jgi:aminocarboxymuconate-semialdehyde decarboxylase
MEPIDEDSARLMIAGSNFRTMTRRAWDIETRLRDMDRSGVDAVVISPMPELLSYWFDAGECAEFCRYVNQSLAERVARNSHRLFGLGIVPLQDPGIAIQHLLEVRQLGLRGVEIGSNVLGKSLGDGVFLPFFEAAAELDLAIFVHGMRPTMLDRLAPGGHLLDGSVGLWTDTGLTVASIIAGGILDRAPKLRIGFSHGGGTFPFCLPRLENSWSGTWDRLPPSSQEKSGLRQAWSRSPTQYAMSMYYDCLVFDRRAVRFLVDMVGAEHVMLGSDYPFLVHDPPMTVTTQAALTPSEWACISSENCLRFMGLT